MEKALRVISRMHKEGVLKEYAIGGAIATIYYTELFATNDVDILIDETPIQFLPAATELEKEAVQHAVAVAYKNHSGKCFTTGIPNRDFPSCVSVKRPGKNCQAFRTNGNRQEAIGGYFISAWFKGKI
jgi:hypothetical protein